MAARTPDPGREHAVRALEAEFDELVGHFRRLLSEQAARVSPGMLPGAYKVFTTIVRREAVTLSALAEQLMMDKGQLSRTVRDLERLGLVRRVPDPSDGRSSLLSPTEQGLERMDVVRTDRRNPLVASLDGWDTADIETLRRLLRALVSGAPPNPAPND
ncbi:MAG: MarR family transcriptional regulator [Microbacterium sp.]|uniref:MarR family winged helix-turn-helix transcriptional regulator n=1 Tax=Microbacterium sp. TaxID=51671 RepID=UPI0039E2B3BC